MKPPNRPSQDVINFHAGPTFAHISTKITEWIRNRFLHTSSQAHLPPQSRRSGISRALQPQTAGFLPEGVWVCVCVCVCKMVRDCCWVPKNEKLLNQTEAELREWVYARLAAGLWALWVCFCVYVGEGGISGAGKGYYSKGWWKRERRIKEKGWGWCRDSELDRIIGLSLRIILFPAQFIPVWWDGSAQEKGSCSSWKSHWCVCVCVWWWWWWWWWWCGGGLGGICA